MTILFIQDQRGSTNAENVSKQKDLVADWCLINSQNVLTSIKFWPEVGLKLILVQSWKGAIEIVVRAV